MMTSVTNNQPATPKQASRKKAAVDRRLDTDLFKALGDPTRAKLLSCLVKCGRPCSVTEVAECCSVDFSVVARHLGLLARTGILGMEKQGRTVWYHARCSDLSARLRALADAIDEWCPNCSGADTEEEDADSCCTPSDKKRTRQTTRKEKSK